MERRSFLRSMAAVPAGAVFPAGLKAFAQAPSPAPSGGAIHPVGAGKDRFEESHSLGFSTILFKLATKDTGGNLFVIEHQNLGHGGPPLHLHHAQEEWFYVMEGEVLFQVGDAKTKLGPGESIVGPRGVPHTFAGVGATPAHMLIGFTPAGRMEAFFREAAVPNGPKMDAALFARFDMQYVGAPLVVA